MTIDELAAKMDEQFAGVNNRFSGVEQKFIGLEQKVDEGFKDSKIRDEELRDLMKFGLEAREVLRDEVMRRFDDLDQKHHEQVEMLKAAVQHRVTKE